MFCAECGKEMSSGAKFCGQCGSMVGSGPNSADLPPVNVAPPTLPPGGEDLDSRERKHKSRKPITVIAAVVTAVFAIALLSGFLNGMAGVFVAGGLFCIGCVLFNVKWFFNNWRAQSVEKIVGNAGVRWFYIGLGIVLILSGAFFNNDASSGKNAGDITSVQKNAISTVLSNYQQIAEMGRYSSYSNNDVALTLSRINIDGCPRDFRVAYLEHVRAWDQSNEHSIISTFEYMMDIAEKYGAAPSY